MPKQSMGINLTVCMRYRPVRLALALRGHVRPPAAVPKRHRAIQRHRGSARVRVPGEREPARPGGVHGRTRPGQFSLVSQGWPKPRRRCVRDAWGVTG